MFKKRKGKYQPLDHVVYGVLAAINTLFPQATDYKERQVWNVEKYVLNMQLDMALKRRADGIRNLFKSIKKSISDLNKLEDSPEKKAALKFWNTALKAFVEKAKLNGFTEEDYKGSKKV